MNPNLGSRQAQPRQEARRDSSSASAPKGAVTCLLSPLQTPPQDTRPQGLVRTAQVREAVTPPPPPPASCPKRHQAPPIHPPPPKSPTALPDNPPLGGR